MGLFGGGYNKPGKGVDKNAPKKKGFFLYWDILIQKFVKFLQLNSLYSVVSIIWIVLLYFFATVALSGHMSAMSEMVTGAQIDATTNENLISAMVFGLCAMFAVGVFMLWGSGPASASFSYIVRCFTRGEHAWIVSDGRDKFKENFKQGIIVTIIDAVILVFGTNALYFYYSAYITYGNMVWMILCYIAFLLIFVYTMIHPYLYQIMVTFECSIGQLYKNAVLLTLANLPINFLLTLIEALLVFLSFMIFSPAIAILFTLILGPCIMRFPGEFYAARVIERSIIKDMKQKNPPVQITYLEEDEV
ncbi:MAG: hypothetical protein LIO59_02520 [Oscillospiraceae bacterium]|nr:hypothetical protein [Oscillospiraceae bacterium]